MKRLILLGAIFIGMAINLVAQVIVPKLVVEETDDIILKVPNSSGGKIKLLNGQLQLDGYIDGTFNNANPDGFLTLDAAGNVTKSTINSQGIPNLKPLLLAGDTIGAIFCISSSCDTILYPKFSGSDGDAWAVNGEDLDSDISRMGKVGIGKIPSQALDIDGQMKLSDGGNIIISDADLLINSSKNFIFGNGQPSANTSGNVIIGEVAGDNSDIGAQNVSIGANSLSEADVHNDNIAIGKSAGISTTGNATGTIFLGKEAGRETSLTGNYNTMLGYRAGYNSSMALYNTLLGYNAGTSATLNSYNALIGRTVLSNGTTRNNNFIAGSNVGLNLDSRDNNIIVGSTTGNDAILLDGNILIGTLAGQKTNLNANNIGIGYATFQEAVIAGGDRNVALGYRAGRRAAAYSSTRNDGNFYIGDSSGDLSTLGTSNYIIGRSVATSLKARQDNFVIGSNAGDLADLTDNNILIGNEAGRASFMLTQNNIQGRAAAEYSAFYRYNNVIGAFAANRVAVGDYNNFFGQATTIEHIPQNQQTVSGAAFDPDAETLTLGGSMLTALLASIIPVDGGAWANDDVILLNIKANTATSSPFGVNTWYLFRITDIATGLLTSVQAFSTSGLTTGDYSVYTDANHGVIDRATAIGYGAMIEHSDQVVLGQANTAKTIGDEILVNGFLKLNVSYNPRGTSIDNGSIFKGTDGALYYKSDGGTVTQIAPN